PPEKPAVVSGRPQEGAFRIVDVDFAGHISTLTVSAAGQSMPLVLKTVSQAAWQAGAAVRLDVIGQARIFCA
ncbi:amino acid ABC transporter substrate-binding protein, partial [Klebsiella aerogenes]|nr:amino acid ABC transporter substrate-binding protein [Klebsiella aerogenes]